MKLEGEQTLLRVYLRNTDKYGLWRLAADTLVSRARQQGLAGATILHGFFGSDINSQLLEAGRFSLVEHYPVIVEFVDAPQAIGRFLSTVQEVITEGTATLERGHVLCYRSDLAPVPAAASGLSVPGTVPDLSTLPSPEEFPAMKIGQAGQLLRVFIGESDVCEGQPLFRAIVLKARELGLCGATVLRGAMGYGANSRMHTTRLLELSTDLPILIEIVDSAEKINALLPFLDQVVKEGLITIEAVHIFRYRQNAEKARV
jgi:PII-like signaling protein